MPRPAQVEQEVFLAARLDTKAGGVVWDAGGGVPGPDAEGASGAAGPEADPRLLRQLRHWYPPMLNDTHRAVAWGEAIEHAVKRFKGAHGGRGPTVLDIGAGTGRSSM